MISQRLSLASLSTGVPRFVATRSRDHLTTTAKDSYSAGNAVLDFNFAAVGAASLSLTQREKFVAQFSQDLTSVNAWWVQQDWAPNMPPKLEIFVSAGYKISRALVPAWEGHQGRMEFPTRRVTEGKAAIAHELVHVYFPNGNRLLAEGLAIYLQQLIGGNSAFPNFGQPLHQVAREILGKLLPGSVDATIVDTLFFAELDRVATPNPLTLRVGANFYGEEARGQWRLYSIAGSFFQFIIDTYGLEKFKELYALTPLVPLQLKSGTPARWNDVYGRSLGEFEAEWKSLICNPAT